MSNPYLIPLRSASTNSTSSTTSTQQPPKRAQATVLMSSSGSIPNSQQLQQQSSSSRSDWLFSGGASTYHQQLPPHKPPTSTAVTKSNSNYNTTNNVRRASLERMNGFGLNEEENMRNHLSNHEQQRPQQQAPVVVRLKSDLPIPNTFDNRSSNFKTQQQQQQPVLERLSSSLTSHHSTGLHHRNPNSTNPPQPVLLENSDGSPIRSLDDIKDILPPASDDAAKELARMIHEQGKALLAIREQENNEMMKRQQQQQQEDELQQQQNRQTTSSYSPSAAARRVLQSSSSINQNNHHLLPSTFAPVPPSRWKVPPTLPPRRSRLLFGNIEDQPRLDLLEMLDKLDEDDRNNNKNSKNQINDDDGRFKNISTGSRITSEIWIYIFEFVDPRTLCLCAEVSKRWLIISRSEFLWQPILQNDFQHLIQEDEEERRFQERTGTVSTTMTLLSSAPPRPSSSTTISPQSSAEETVSTTTTMLTNCPSLIRISTFVKQHRDRIQHELTSIEMRIQQTENRILMNSHHNQGSSQNQNQQQTASVTISGLERELTNERSVLLRHLQELEPKVRQLVDRLRDAEATQMTQTRALNEAIVSSKRSGLQLQAIHRRSQIADRRHKERAALEDLERRLCVAVLNGAGGLLPVSLRKSVRTFSQLELLLMSCANQESLANLPKRWEKVKESCGGGGVIGDLIEEIKKQVDECEDVNGVLGKILLSLSSSVTTGSSATSSMNLETSNRVPINVSKNNNKMENQTSGDSGRIRFADSLLNRRKQQQAQDSSHSTVESSRSSSSSTTFAQDHELVRKRLVAEMALRMTDQESLERFLFS